MLMLHFKLREFPSSCTRPRTLNQHSCLTAESSVTFLCFRIKLKRLENDIGEELIIFPNQLSCLRLLPLRQGKRFTPTHKDSFHETEEVSRVVVWLEHRQAHMNTRFASPICKILYKAIAHFQKGSSALAGSLQSPSRVTECVTQPDWADYLLD